METDVYYCLLKKFLEGQISLDAFITSYSVSLKNETKQIDEEIFRVLEDLFEDIDAYSPNLLPENETYLAISYKTLMSEIKFAYNKLCELVDVSEIRCE